jgi:hypothetical protein
MGPMTTAAATADILPIYTYVAVEVDEFEPVQTGKLAGETQEIDGELFYLVNLTSGWQEWVAVTSIVYARTN